MTHNGRRSADERLAAELAAGRTVRDAAGCAGVSERTAFRRLEDPTFTARVSELRSQMIRAGAGRLAVGMSEAAGVLRALLASESETIRLRAAVALVGLVVNATELIELQAEISELGRRIREVNGQ